MRLDEAIGLTATSFNKLRVGGLVLAEIWDGSTVLAMKVGEPEDGHKFLALLDPVEQNDGKLLPAMYPWEEDGKGMAAIADSAGVVPDWTSLKFFGQGFAGDDDRWLYVKDGEMFYRVFHYPDNYGRRAPVYINLSTGVVGGGFQPDMQTLIYTRWALAARIANREEALVLREFP